MVVMEDQLSALLIGLAVVIASSIWVAVDSRTHKIHQLGQKAYTEQDPFVWGVACFLFWIIFFPLYLMNRSTVLAGKRSTEPESAARCSEADELLKYKELLDRGAISEDEFNAAKSRLLPTAQQPNTQGFLQMK